MTRVPRLIRVLASVAVALSSLTAAHAEEVPAPCNTLKASTPAVQHPRLDRLVVDGLKVNVLVPPAYRGGTTRYPVLYLFHGAFEDHDRFVALTDLIAFTGALPEAQQAIVVMPDGGNLYAVSDWHDGTKPQETQFLTTLMPFVDTTYRTIADRAYRAAAGFSGGGMDAMILTARHPDLFVAAGSFSGFVDQRTARGMAVVTAFLLAENATCGANNGPYAIWGDPILHPMGWAGHDPTDLAPNLMGHALHVASGNGVACADDDPVTDPAGTAGGLVTEHTVFEMSQNLSKALAAAGVPHRADFYGCGLHTDKYVQRNVHAFWPQMVAAFGTPPPAAFDYRTVERHAAVYGWELFADPARAPEFLELRNASRAGFSISGSGATRVITAPIFAAHQQVHVGINGVVSTLTADASGRLAIAISLGAPHVHEQETLAAQTQAALDPHYVKTAVVRLAAIP